MICQVSEPRGSSYVVHKPLEIGSKDFDEAIANACLIAHSLDVLKAASSLINQLPDCVIDWARDGIGHTQAACIIADRDTLRAVIAKAKGETDG